MPPQEEQPLASSAYSYEKKEGEDEDAGPTERRRSSVHFSTIQKLDPDHPMIRRSLIRRESFIVQFAKTKGPPEITFLMMLVAIGLGSTIGVVPAVMSDRFARMNHGYEDAADCASYGREDDNLKPPACFMGSADAQAAAASSNLISNVLTFLTSSLIGSFSDEHGRRGNYIFHHAPQYNTYSSLAVLTHSQQNCPLEL
jgi:hypothetical protein